MVFRLTWACGPIKPMVGQTISRYRILEKRGAGD